MTQKENLIQIKLGDSYLIMHTNHMYICRYIYIHIYIHKCVYVYICTYVYIYI